MAELIDPFPNYTRLSLPLALAHGSVQQVSVMVCKKCGVMVGNMIAHDRWHEENRWST